MKLLHSERFTALWQAIGEATKDPEISAAYMRQLSADQGSETKLKDALD